jgi:hypothetical protein
VKEKGILSLKLRSTKSGRSGENSILIVECFGSLALKKNISSRFET